MERTGSGVVVALLELRIWRGGKHSLQCCAMGINEIAASAALHHDSTDHAASAGLCPSIRMHGCMHACDALILHITRHPARHTSRNRECPPDACCPALGLTALRPTIMFTIIHISFWTSSCLRCSTFQKVCLCCAAGFDAACPTVTPIPTSSK